MSNFSDTYDRSNQSGYSEKHLREQFKNEVTVTDGVVRWNMGNIVPADIVADFAKYSLIGLSCIPRTKIARDKHSAEFLAEYVENQKNRSPEQIAEEMYEMRAAFGPGETVVDVFTGQEYKL